MENLTKRQNLIFRKIVKEYIKRAEPVSSQFLDDKYNLDISPATIRSEMKKLDELGFLFQPYSSSGRVPTDKGYRYFVNNILNKECQKENKRILEEAKKIKKEIDDYIKFTQNIARLLSSFSSNLAIAYLKKDGLLWKEGWEQVFKEPEFLRPEFLLDFIGSVNYLENNINEFCSSISSQLEVFIGKENPLRKFDNLSFISSWVDLEKPKEKSFFIILGPKRMDYSKNISILNSILKTLEV